MKSDRIRELLRELRQELDDSGEDPSSLEALRTLDADIHRMLEARTPEPEAEGLIDRARELETEFATRHPVAERVLRELVDMLSRMGV